MTKAFDQAQFIPAAAPTASEVVEVLSGGGANPLKTDWASFAKSPPGVTVGASMPAASAPNQILISGAGPNFSWGLGAQSGALVASVAGKTGVVTLTHSDITDWAANMPPAYVLPTASATVLGGVKVDGSSITVSGGVISAPSTPGIADAPSDGATYARKNAAWAYLTHSDITDWAAALAPYALIASVPAPYLLPTASTTVLGGIKIDGATLTIANGVVSVAGGGGGGIPDAPSDGASYLRSNNAWTSVIDAGTF